jgi:hypothetical protein
MKVFFGIIIGFLLYYSSLAQPAARIMDIDNHGFSIDSMSRKKILVIVLPLQRDTAVVNQLLRFQSRHARQVRIIGLVCWGNSNPPVDSVRNIYEKLVNEGVIITQGMGATDAAVNEREGVLKWVSDMNRNRRANPFAVGTKYFISEGGRLFAQPGKSSSLDSRVLDNIVQTIVPGEGNKSKAIDSAAVKNK